MALMYRSLVVFLLLAALPIPSLAFRCADGQESHVATAEEASSAGKSRDGSTNAIIAGTTQVCPEDAKAGISGDAGEAKAYLLSIARNLRNSAAPPTKERIDPLNASFAICEAKFLKAYTNAHGPIYVVSAFRCGPNSPSEIKCDRSENARAGGAGASNHQVGLAVDVNPADGNYAQAHSFAQSNQQYGVWFRLGMDDRPHMEPVNKSSPSCDGVAGTPADSPGSGGNTPSSGYSQALRDYLGGGQQNGGGGDMGGGGMGSGMGGGGTGGGMSGGGSGGGQVPTGIQGFGPGGATPYNSMQPANNTSPANTQQPATGATPSSGSQIGNIAQGKDSATPATGAQSGTIATPSSTAQPSDTQSAVSSVLQSDTATPASGNKGASFDLISSLAFPATIATSGLIAYTGAVPSTVTLNENTVAQQTAEPYDASVPTGVGAQGGRVTLNTEPGAGGWSTFPPESPEGGGSGATFSSSQSELFDTLENIRQILLRVIELLRPFRYVQGGFGEEEHYE